MEEDPYYVGGTVKYVDCENQFQTLTQLLTVPRMELEEVWRH